MHQALLGEPAGELELRQGGLAGHVLLLGLLQRLGVLLAALGVALDLDRADLLPLLLRRGDPLGRGCLLGARRGGRLLGVPHRRLLPADGLLEEPFQLLGRGRAVRA